MATHYLITNRGIIKKNGKESIRTDGKEEARDELRYGTISFKPSQKSYDIKLFADPSEKELVNFATEDRLPSNTRLGSQRTFEELYDRTRKEESRKGDILFFIHGFKSDLDVAMNTVMELHRQYVEDPGCPVGHIVIFTWPAMSKLFKYRNDARDAEISGYALARSFNALKRFFHDTFVKDRKQMCRQKIHLMCHSMGNRVLESMFRELQVMNTDITNMFGEALLVGADVDYNCLESPKPLYRLIDICERVHVYYHNNDQALGISEMTKNAYNRLGRWGAKNSLQLPDDVFQSDVTDVNDDRGVIQDVVNHWYYYNSKSVVDDIIEVLNGGVSVYGNEF